MFEYMAMAKPIIASELEQIGEILKPALHARDFEPSGRQLRDDQPYLAILCRPGVPEDICSGIKFVIENPDWRCRLGQRARQRILDRYTWEHHVRAVLGD